MPMGMITSVKEMLGLASKKEYPTPAEIRKEQMNSISLRKNISRTSGGINGSGKNCTPKGLIRIYMKKRPLLGRWIALRH